MSDDDPLERRRRQREASKRRKLTFAIIGGGLLAAALLVVVVIMVRGRIDSGGGGLFGPSESSEGEKWTHKELAEYLNKNGVQVEIRPWGGALTDPTSLFVEPGAADGEGVGVILTKSPKDARERSASFGANSFSWGRFVFGGANQQLVARIRTALVGK